MLACGSGRSSSASAALAAEGQGALEVGHRRRPAAPARPRRRRGAECPACGQTGVTRVTLSSSAVEDADQGRPHHDRVGQADRIGVLVRQPLHVADHVVAQEAEQAGRHRRQAGRQLHLAFADQRCAASRAAGRRAARRRAASDAGAAVDLGLALGAAPDHVRLEADDRIAAAHRAALDRFRAGRNWRGRRPA